MRKNLFAVSILLPILGIAQENQSFGTFNKQVACAPIQVIFKALADPDIKEQPFWIGKDESEKSDYVIFVNDKTKAFTIVQIGKEVGCIIGVGYKSYLVDDKKL